jgi:hypothetical protein
MHANILTVSYVAFYIWIDPGDDNLVRLKLQIHILFLNVFLSVMINLAICCDNHKSSIVDVLAGATGFCIQAFPSCKQRLRSVLRFVA